MSRPRRAVIPRTDGEGSPRPTTADPCIRTVHPMGTTITGSYDWLLIDVTGPAAALLRRRRIVLPLESIVDVTVAKRPFPTVLDDELRVPGLARTAVRLDLEG